MATIVMVGGKSTGVIQVILNAPLSIRVSSTPSCQLSMAPSLGSPSWS
ncbi:hypothetical protein [Marinomonas sp. S3726]|nr:hypothetical protein [Marinomonas sp. S3726]